MIPARPEPSPMPEGAVRVARDAYGEPLQAADESQLAVGLDQQVEVIGLNARVGSRSSS